MSKHHDKGPECRFSIDTLLLTLSAIGALVIMLSLFLPLWRYDSIGMTPLKDHWFLSDAFETRSYGLLSVSGWSTQTWNTLTLATCDFRTFQTASTAIQSIGSIGSGDDACAGGESCGAVFLTHMDQRCQQYEQIQRISTVSLCFTFISFTMVVAATMTGCLSNHKRTGGIIFGLYICACIFCLVINVTWAFVTDGAFKKLAESAWYPYPSLHVAYYMHLFGCLMVLVCALIWGHRKLPEVCGHDPAADKLKKHMRKMDRLKFAMGMGQPVSQPYWQEHLNLQTANCHGEANQQAYHFEGGKGQGKGYNGQPNVMAGQGNVVEVVHFGAGPPGGHQMPPMPPPGGQQMPMGQQMPPIGQGVNNGIHAVAPIPYGQPQQQEHFTMPPLAQPPDAPRPQSGAFGGAPPIPAGYQQPHSGQAAHWPAARDAD